MVIGHVKSGGVELVGGVTDVLEEACSLLSISLPAALRLSW